MLSTERAETCCLQSGRRSVVYIAGGEVSSTEQAAKCWLQSGRRSVVYIGGGEVLPSTWQESFSSLSTQANNPRLPSNVSTGLTFPVDRSNQCSDD